MEMAALDPAGAAFWKWKFIPDLVLPKQRLHRGDALFVDVYHTSSFFGCRKKLGTVDFYINGGESQPSCVPQFLSHLIRDYLQICSHNYVTALFAKSISDNSTKACQCPSYGSYLNKTCDCSSSAVVGEFIDTNAYGIFYVNTPRDEKAVGNFLQSWQNFNLNTLMQQFRDMICTETTGNSTITYYDD